MRHFNRKNISRFSALMLVLLLLCSFTASYAASKSFKKSDCGVKYGGKTFKLGNSYSSSDLKKAFGKWDKREADIACSFGYATYKYTFKSKGIVIETLKKKQKDKKEQIISIELKKKNVPTLAGVKVGAKASTMVNKYGKPNDGGEWKNGNYRMGANKNNDKISRIVFYIDM